MAGDSSGGAGLMHTQPWLEEQRRGTGGHEKGLGCYPAPGEPVAGLCVGPGTLLQAYDGSMSGLSGQSFLR